MFCYMRFLFQYFLLLLFLVSACVLLVFGVADDKSYQIIGGIVCTVFAAFLYAAICWQTIRKEREQIDARSTIIIRSPIPVASV